MPFKAISCHVWAIDGYVDDDTASTVNANYTKIANSLKVANNKAARSSALAEIVTHTRMSKLTDKEAIVYGGFRRNQNAPEHMWFEYDGKIYETMPGYDLHTEDATPASRLCPHLENEAFGDAGVGVLKTFLTVNQKAYLDTI